MINNHDSSTKGLWIDSSPSGWGSWASTTLVNAFNASETVTVQSDGRVYLSAPSRGYKVFVKQSDYVAFSDPGARVSQSELIDLEEHYGEPEFQIFANPVKNKVQVNIATPVTQAVSIEFISTTGAQILKVQGQTNKTLVFDLSTHPNGMYIIRATIGSHTHTRKVIKE